MNGQQVLEQLRLAHLFLVYFADRHQILEEQNKSLALLSIHIDMVGFGTVVVDHASFEDNPFDAFHLIRFDLSASYA